MLMMRSSDSAYYVTAGFLRKKIGKEKVTKTEKKSRAVHPDRFLIPLSEVWLQ